MIQDFLMKAVQGGWKPKDNLVVDKHNENTFAQLVLDPAAWQAVGKVEGWEPIGYADTEYTFFDTTNRIKNVEEWYVKMHRMIDALAEGKTIEQFLQDL